MKYFIRMWDNENQRYEYLLEIESSTSSLWTWNEAHTPALFNTVEDAQQAIVDHRWSMTEIKVYEKELA